MLAGRGPTTWRRVVRLLAGDVSRPSPHQTGRPTLNPLSHSLTVILLGEVCRRLEDLRDEGGVDLPHGQVLDAVRVPVHVVTDALQRGWI